MALVSGRYASVKFSTSTAETPIIRPNTLTYMASWDLAISLDTMDATYFGSVWKSNMVGMQGYSGSVTGFIDVTTQTSQHNALIDCAIEGFLIRNLWLHEGQTSSGNFWAPNSYSTYGGVCYSGDNGMYISNLKIGASKDAINSLSFDFVGNGSLIYMAGGSSGYVVLAESTLGQSTGV